VIPSASRRVTVFAFPIETVAKSLVADIRCQGDRGSRVDGREPGYRETPDVWINSAAFWMTKRPPRNIAGVREGGPIEGEVVVVGPRVIGLDCPRRSPVNGRARRVCLGYGRSRPVDGAVVARSRLSEGLPRLHLQVRARVDRQIVPGHVAEAARITGWLATSGSRRRRSLSGPLPCPASGQVPGYAAVPVHRRDRRAAASPRSGCCPRHARGSRKVDVGGIPAVVLQIRVRDARKGDCGGRGNRGQEPERGRVPAGSRAIRRCPGS
jgi:hypothetical protein